jgi:kumamolisin
LTGHVPKQIRTAIKLGRLAAEENVDLSLVVRVDQDLLDQTLAQLYGPSAAQPRHFLGSAEFAQKFDLADKRQKLKDFAQSAGLTVNSADDQPNSLVVKVSGLASLVEKAFAVKLYHYQGADGQIFRAHETEPVVPAFLAPHLNAVLGLSNYRGARRPHLRFRPAPALPEVVGGAQSGAVNRVTLLPGSHGPAGLSPADIDSIYGLNGTLTGSGQTVALYELDGFTPSDITFYENYFGISPITVTPIFVDGASGACGSGCGEVTLDIELVTALAPGVSKILVYEGNQNDDSGAIDTYDRIAADDSAQVVSTSWGLDEEDLGGAAMSSENTTFKKMAAQGQTIYAASGDEGAYDASGQPGSVASPSALLTDDPASQPYVTGVGGTSLTGSVSNPTEKVWNDGCTSGNPGEDCSAAGSGASGGGIASYGGYWPIPSWQSGVAGIASSMNRNVPDVALNADEDNSPYSIYQGGQWWSYGGTSCAAPLWAALTALVNQKLGSFGPLGFANPTIYKLAASVPYTTYTSYFNDITIGSNGAYSAATGYDNASGWGSFKGDALINAIEASYLPAPQNLTATALGTSSITWTWGSVAGAASYAFYPSTGGLAMKIGATSLTQTGLSANTAYGASVAAVTSSTGPLSAAVTIYTLAAPPLSFALVQVNGSSLTVSWAANNNPVNTSYSVEYWQVTGATFTLTTQASPAAVMNLFGGATYYLTVSALNGEGLPAPSGIFLTTATLPYGSATIGSSGGTVMNGGATLQIPAAAFSQNVQVSLQPVGGLTCSLSPVETLTPVGLALQAVVSPAIEPNPTVTETLSMSYQDADLGNIDFTHLTIAYCDTVTNAWIPLNTIGRDTVNKTVTAATGHLSIFQIMQAIPTSSVSQFQIGPNPLRLSRGAQQMGFRGPVGAEVRIFTLTGELVKELSLGTDGSGYWDATNKSGHNVASGVYFVYVKDGRQNQTFKVIVER